MRATGIGPMPGDDLASALTTIRSELSLPFLPELPARGPHAAGTGRSVAVITGLDFDLEMNRWRLASGTGLDHSRAQAMLAHDLDILEQQCLAYEGALKLQVTGPLTLATRVELPRSGRALADRGATHELAQALADGMSQTLSELQRRVPGAELIVQLNESAVPDVISGAVTTITGAGTLTRMDQRIAQTLLRTVTDAIRAAGAAPAVYCGSDDVPVALLTGAGADAVSFELARVAADDRWASALDSGHELWPALIPVPAADTGVIELRRRLSSFVHALGFDVDTVHAQLAVTPRGGLDSAGPAEAGRSLALGQKLADSVP